jgi:CHAD domain-containing protein
MLITSMSSKSARRQAVPKELAARGDIAARTLAGLLRDIVASGRKPVETPDISDTDAVHDLRKAIKAWRAMMRLITPSVGAEAEALRIESRDLAREIAAARDGQAAQEALSDLLADPGGDLPGVPARGRAAIVERLAALRASAEAICLTPDRRDRISRMWSHAGAAIERWPLDRFDHTEATRQLAASYHRVRVAIPEDWSKASAEALHKFRQQVVEHRYQMELAEPLWPKIMRVWVSEAQKLRDRLGTHHDLAILKNLTAPNKPLGRWHAQLKPLIAARQKKHVETAQRLTGRLFAETPKAFSRRLAALWEHSAEDSD